MPEEQPKEEKLKFLKREEIRTMDKDVAHLREMEAQKERERIAVQPMKEEEKKRQQQQQEIKQEIKKGPVSEGLPVEQVERAAPNKKNLIRAMIVVLFILMAGFIVWLLMRPPKEVALHEKEIVPPEEVLPPEEEVLPPEEITLPEIFVPVSLISVSTTTIFEITKPSEIKPILDGLRAQDSPIRHLNRIVLKNITGNKLVTLKEILVLENIILPVNVFSKLEDNYTAAFFSQIQGKRLIFVTEIKERPGLDIILKNGEPDIIKQVSPIAPYFRQTYYKNISFRYLTISKQDFGVCYCLLDNYFILTTSYKGLKKMIDELIEI